MIGQIDIEKTLALRPRPDKDTLFVSVATVVNRLVDTVNEIKQYLDWDEISGAENCKCAKNTHKSDLEEALEGFPGLFKSNKDEPLVDAVIRDVKKINQKVNFGQPEVKKIIKSVLQKKRLREALSLAESALIRLANEAYDMNQHVYIDAILSRIDKITKGGKDEQ